jgi:hypothetical protein
MLPGLPDPMPLGHKAPRAWPPHMQGLPFEFRWKFCMLDFLAVKRCFKKKLKPVGEQMCWVLPLLVFVDVLLHWQWRRWLGH